MMNATRWSLIKPIRESPVDAFLAGVHGYILENVFCGKTWANYTCVGQLRHRISDHTLLGIYLTVKERNDKTTPLTVNAKIT